MSDVAALPSDLAGSPGDLVGDISQLARAVDVQGAQFAWLLGAGASAMSDIPTAGALVLRFKHELFCSAHQFDVQDLDPGDPRTRASIWRVAIYGREARVEHAELDRISRSPPGPHRSPDVQLAITSTPTPTSSAASSSQPFLDCSPGH